MVQQPWSQGQVVEVEITDLSDRGDGVARWQQQVVFVPGTVTGDRARVRLVHIKGSYGHGKLEELLEPSPHRVRPACIVADKCGGCQWQQVAYDHQQTTKQHQVIQALQRIGQFQHPVVHPVLAPDQPLGYRNKVTYPLGRSATGQVQAGYYRKSSHHLVNLNQCPVQDPHFNPLLAELKQDIQAQGWSIYNEATHQGQLRHLSLRIGRRTGEILLTLVAKDATLPGLESQAQAWLQRYDNLVGVCLNCNPDRTNRIFGPQTQCLAGQPYLTEIFGGLTLRIRPQTFFQIHTEQAEVLLQVMISSLDLKGSESIVDAYCGIGTLTLPLAGCLAPNGQIVGIELQAEAVAQAQDNARLNQITNASFQVGKVEQILPHLSQSPEVVILDPPRKGCVPAVLQTLQQLEVQRIIYVSCKPATLARDLKILCGEGAYQLRFVQPLDLFPQTAHVESVAVVDRL
jgi:23S rRNA (uracil1939-C5)-methyltransferase